MTTTVPTSQLQTVVEDVRRFIADQNPTAEQVIARLNEHAERLRVTPTALFILLSDAGVNLLPPLTGTGCGNGASTPQPQEWNGLGLRSRAEAEIAKALHRAGVLFFANARCLFPEGEDQKAHREADFLVMRDGRWAVLEVDGRLWHEATAADDHHRDRLFKRHGAWTVERFDADRCTQEPDAVVAEFLSFLAKS